MERGFNPIHLKKFNQTYVTTKEEVEGDRRGLSPPHVIQ